MRRFGADAASRETRAEQEPAPTRVVIDTSLCGCCVRTEYYPGGSTRVLLRLLKRGALGLRLHPIAAHHGRHVLPFCRIGRAHLRSVFVDLR